MRAFLAVGIVLLAGTLTLVAVYSRSVGDEGDSGPSSNQERAFTQSTATFEPDSERRSETVPENEHCLAGASGTEGPLVGRTIILDPGHGGEDLGTVNTTFDLTESELVLPISERLRDRLTAAGANVCLTRIDDTYIGLGARAEFANENGGDAFVSIHLNSLPNPDENYVMAMWGNEAKDRFLARTLVDSLRYEMAEPVWHRGEQNPINPEIYLLRGLDSNMLRNAQMPAALVEASFLSATWEAQAFTDGINDGTHWRENQIAAAIFHGLVEFFESFSE